METNTWINETQKECLNCEKPSHYAYCGECEKKVDLIDDDSE